MAASALDKARKSYSYLQKTLNANIDASVTALTPNNVTSIPTDTGVSFVIDRVDSAGNKTPTLRELMTGVISGGNLTSLIRGEQGTTAQPHLANAVIEFVNSGEMWNDLIDFLLQDHSNPNGNHKTLTDDNGNEWLERSSVASAVNQVKVTNAITAKNPKISAGGDDATIQLDLEGKGTTGYAVARNPEVVDDHIVTNTGVWSGLGYGTTLTAAMTAATCYINGRRIVIAAIATRTFTASKDTYVDVLDNLDGTGTVVYTEVANNAASPALAANSIRLAIVVSAATIVAAASVNQGQESMLVPIISSVPLATTDSLGNMICNRNPRRTLIGLRQMVTDFSTATSGSYVDVTQLVTIVNVPAGRKIKISARSAYIKSSEAAGQALEFALFEGASIITTEFLANPVSGFHCLAYVEMVLTPTAGVHTYKVAVTQSAAGTIVVDGSKGAAQIKVELV